MSLTCCLLEPLLTEGPAEAVSRRGGTGLGWEKPCTRPPLQILRKYRASTESYNGTDGMIWLSGRSKGDRESLKCNGFCDTFEMHFSLRAIHAKLLRPGEAPDLPGPQALRRPHGDLQSTLSPASAPAPPSLPSWGPRASTIPIPHPSAPHYPLPAHP